MVQKSANLKCRIKQHHNKDTSMSRDYNQFPDDENGNVLWQMHPDGDDLQEAHEIEFSIALADEAQADRCALHLLKEEQKISLFRTKKAILWNGSSRFMCIWSLPTKISWIWNNGSAKSRHNFRANMMVGVAWSMSMMMSWMTKRAVCVVAEHACIESI